MAEKKSVKTSEIDAKIKEHEESLKAVVNELQQLAQAHNERTQQKIALEGAIAGLREFSQPDAPSTEDGAEAED